MTAETTYILTAELDDSSFEWIDGLRRQHFPPERNFLSAHLTLFHRLSTTQIAALHSMPMPNVPIDVSFDRTVFLGFGVALHVQSIGLEKLRQEARVAMGGEFSRQDSQPWRPHVTIQNKVSPESARQLQHVLNDSFAPRGGAATGLLVWEYLGGPWRPVSRLPF